MKNRMETLVHAAAAWIRTSRLGFLVGEGGDVELLLLLLLCVRWVSMSQLTAGVGNDQQCTCMYVSDVVQPTIQEHHVIVPA